MTVYVAAPSEHYSWAANAAARLRVAGIEVSHPWWRQVAQDRREGRTDADLSVEAASTIAAECLAGVRRSSVLLWISHGSIGAAHEAGAARILGIPIVILGEPHPIFGAGLPVFDDMDEAVEAVAEIVRAVGR